MKLFAIPGLGVDGRVFQKLQHYIPQIEVIEWLEPQKNESLQAYAKRMAEPMLDFQGPKLMIGISFGGVVAQEISTFLPLDGLILLSTFKKGDERPWFFSIGEKIPVYSLLRGKLRYHFLPMMGPFIGIPDKEDQLLLQDMFMSASISHRIWGASQIVKWRGVDLNMPWLHVHGLEDRVFPASNISYASMIKGTGHFMVSQEAEQVANLMLTWAAKHGFANSSS